MNNEVMKLMFVTLGGQEVIDDAYLERGDFWPKILEYGNAVAKATMNDAVVELTDDEIEASVRSDRRPGTFFDRIDFARAVIAAHIAKQGVQREL